MDLRPAHRDTRNGQRGPPLRRCPRRDTWRITGLDGKSYTAVRRNPIDDEYDHCMRTAAEIGFPLPPLTEGQVVVRLATVLAVESPAGETDIRGGAVPPPPVWWTRQRSEGHSARAQANDLAVWQIEAQAEAGRFEYWREAAGIAIVRGRLPPSRKLSYPMDLERGAPGWSGGHRGANCSCGLPMSSGPGYEADLRFAIAGREHQAALGRFYAFWLRPDEWVALDTAGRQPATHRGHHLTNRPGAAQGGAWPPSMTTGSAAESPAPTS